MSQQYAAGGMIALTNVQLQLLSCDTAEEVMDLLGRQNLEQWPLFAARLLRLSADSRLRALSERGKAMAEVLRNEKCASHTCGCAKSPAARKRFNPAVPRTGDRWSAEEEARMLVVLIAAGWSGRAGEATMSQAEAAGAAVGRSSRAIVFKLRELQDNGRLAVYLGVLTPDIHHVYCQLGYCVNAVGVRGL